MQPSTFDGNLELVHFTFDATCAWTEACTERFFSVFVPNTDLAWQYAQFPLPTLFTNLKSLHIQHDMTESQSALVAPGMTQLEFPFLTKLHLQGGALRLLDLRAPRLASLHTSGFIPSDLRHLSNSTLSSIHVEFTTPCPGSREIYLPSADKIQLDLEMDDLFRLNVHPPQILAVATRIFDNNAFPTNWTVSGIPEMLGTVIDLKVEKMSFRGKQYSSDTITSFLKPFMHLKCLTLLCPETGDSTWIDQVAPHLADPNFLPNLEAITFSEYPSWLDFFFYIQQRQIGFISGNFQARLKEITFRGSIHGALLDHMRLSLGGIYTGVFSLPFHHKDSKEWPVRPFDPHQLDTDGLLCCYVCYKACLEIACLISPSEDASDMLYCGRHYPDQKPSNTVFAL